MPAKEIIAGISISDNVSFLSVLEHRSDEIELLFLDEYKRSDNEEFWYISSLDRYLEEHRTKVNQVAVALDAAKLIILNCPLDISLTQSERNEQVAWELSHYISTYQAKEYINDIHVLETRAQDHVQNVLAVAVRRKTIFGLQEVLDKRGLTLGVVDVNHFATENALLRSHPEIGKAVCACIGLNQSRIDASILRNGHMTEYRYSVSTEEQDHRTFLEKVLHQHSSAGVYLYGTNLTKEQEKMVKSSSQSSTIILNPFRKILLSPNFPGFTPYIPYTYRFAAAVGIALRKG